jgi:hypothetical protein
MRLKFVAGWLLSALLCVVAQAAPNSALLARQAVSEDVAEARAAIEKLRAQGPAGLDALFQTHDADIKKRLNVEFALNAPDTDDAWLRIAGALDAVAQQKDSYAAHLYWHTDLEQAKTAARQTGRPILSLRLLGNLTDEFSCANSRFFRAALYANAEVSAYLRGHFILHWSSERAAPRITVDFGDGRKIERTITGNSIHYILDADGQPVDAIPGLYGPNAFLRALQRAEMLAKSLKGQSGAARLVLLQAYHSNRVAELNKLWAQDLARAGVSLERKDEAVAVAAAPSAATAAPLAVTKRAVEIPLVREVNPDPRELGKVTDEAAWQKLAALHLSDARLDENSRALMARHLPPLVVNRKLAPTGRLYAMMQNFQQLMALDTVRNEYLMHARLHSWFTGQALNFETLNRRVYAELFRTPRTDAWLGLYGEDTYTGLENGGVKP